MRHLLAQRQGGALAEAVRSTLQAARLSAGISQLLVLLAQQEGRGGAPAAVPMVDSVPVKPSALPTTAVAAAGRRGARA